MRQNSHWIFMVFFILIDPCFCFTSRLEIRKANSWEQCLRSCAERIGCMYVFHVSVNCYMSPSPLRLGRMPDVEQYRKVNTIEDLQKEKNYNYSQMVFDVSGHFIVAPTSGGMKKYMFSTTSDKYTYIVISYACLISPCCEQNCVDVFCLSLSGNSESISSNGFKGIRNTTFRYDHCQTISLYYREPTGSNVILNVSIHQVFKSSHSLVTAKKIESNTIKTLDGSSYFTTTALYITTSLKIPPNSAAPDNVLSVTSSLSHVKPSISSTINVVPYVNSPSHKVTLDITTSKTVLLEIKPSEVIPTDSTTANSNIAKTMLLNIKPSEVIPTDSTAANSNIAKTVFLDIKPSEVIPPDSTSVNSNIANTMLLDTKPSEVIPPDITTGNSNIAKTVLLDIKPIEITSSYSTTENSNIANVTSSLPNVPLDTTLSMNIPSGGYTSNVLPHATSSLKNVPLYTATSQTMLYITPSENIPSNSITSVFSFSTSPSQNASLNNTISHYMSSDSTMLNSISANTALPSQNMMLSQEPSLAFTLSQNKPTDSITSNSISSCNIMVDIATSQETLLAITPTMTMPSANLPSEILTPGNNLLDTSTTERTARIQTEKTDREVRTISSNINREHTTTTNPSNDGSTEENDASKNSMINLSKSTAIAVYSSSGAIAVLLTISAAAVIIRIKLKSRKRNDTQPKPVSLQLSEIRLNERYLRGNNLKSIID